MNRTLPKFIKPKQLSELIINEIQEKISLESSECNVDSLETSDWLNGIINWFFLNLSESSQVKSVLDKLIAEIVVDIRRSPLGHLLTDSELDIFELGGTAPRIEKVRIITGSSLREPTSDIPLTLQFDLEYDGICRILMKFDTIFKIKINVETFIKQFKGSFCVVIQDKTIHFCFLKVPSVLETETSVGFSTTNRFEYQLPFLNSLFSGGWLYKKAIGSGCCFPDFVGQWYRAGPEQPPYPWTAANPELLYTWTPKEE